MSSVSKVGRYRHLSRLGRGGMSHVELAEDSLLGRRVALKHMNASDDSGALLRLRREALIGASVSHPNLVSIYDIVAAEGGEYVIVMEYVDGQTLRDRLAGGRKLPPSEGLRILDGVASALDAIHARGIVHRDVKPSNILLATNGDVKLADLGIASAPDRTRITAEGVLLGTLGYVAPEQLEGTPVTPATDIYALAVVAYEILSGRKARSEPNAVALAHAIATRPPPDLRDAWPDAPSAAAELLIRALAADPAERPGSATELTRSLREAIEAPLTRPLRIPPASAEPATTLQAKLPAAAGLAAAKGATFPGSTMVDPEPSRRGEPRRPEGARRRPGDNSVVYAKSRRRGPVAAVLLAMLAVAAIVAVLVGQATGGPAAKKASVTHSHRGATSRRHHRRASKLAQTSSTGSSSSGGPTAAASSGGSSPPASAGGAAAGATGTGTPPAGTPAANTPIGAAERFYTLAAAHRYAEAWALADPTFRNQLEGYAAFQNGQALDRSITFDYARVVSQTQDTATLAVRTTSVRANGTQHCSGTIQLVRATSGWLIHLIGINCT